MKKCWLVILFIATTSKLFGFNNFDEFRLQNIFTDIVLVSKDEVEFPCHKLVLSAFSDHFEKLLTNGMKESKQSKIYLSYSKEVLSIVLDFIYYPNKVLLENSLISLELYIDLLDFSKAYFIENLALALKRIKIDIKKDDFVKNFKIALIYEDENLLEQIFSNTYIKPLNEVFRPTIKYILGGHTHNIHFANFNNDNTRILTASLDQTAKLWDANTGKEIFSLPHVLIKNPPLFINNENNIITIASPSIVSIWDIIDGKEIFSFDTKTEISSFSLSLDESKMVTTHFDNSAKVFDLYDGEEIYNLEHLDLINYGAFNNSGTRAITCSKDKTAKIWEMETGKCYLTLNGHEASVLFAMFNSDETKAVSTSCDKAAIIWDANNGSKLFILDGHKNWVIVAKFCFNDRRLISIELDSNGKIWDPINGKEIFIVDKSLNNVEYLSFGNNSLNIVVSSGKNMIKIVDIYDGKKILIWSGPQFVRYSSFSKDNTNIITLSYNQEAYIWNMPPVELYSYRALFKSKVPLLWLRLKYHLLTYFNELKEGEKPVYQDFMSKEYMKDEELISFIQELNQSNTAWINYMAIIS